MTRLPSGGRPSFRAETTFGRVPSGDGNSSSTYSLRSGAAEVASKVLGGAATRRREASKAGHDGELCLQCLAPQSTDSIAAYAEAKCRSIFMPLCKHGPFCPRCRNSCSRRVLPACVCRALLTDTWTEAPWPTATGMEGQTSTTTASTASGGSAAVRSGSSAGRSAPNGTSSVGSAMDIGRVTPLPVHGPQLPPKAEAVGPSLPKLSSTLPEAALPPPVGEVSKTENRNASAHGTLNLPPRVPMETSTAKSSESSGGWRHVPDGTASAPLEAAPKIKRPWAGTEDRPKVRTRCSAGGLVLPEVAAQGTSSVPASFSYRRERPVVHDGAKPRALGIPARGNAGTRHRRVTAGASEESHSSH
mmetsp:Transcript_6430/g.14165  ORF Transcript_6430/g.14165 Transcript_6430/m.14165 type:complete len:360 (+) Transcript_6430:43-1122(+)